MDIHLERPLAELGNRGLWSAFEDSFGWIVYSFMLIIAAFILESSVSMAKGSLSVTLGGPVSWLGLAGAAGLCMHTIRKRKAANRVYSEMIKGDEVCFYRFRETGFIYGVRTCKKITSPDLYWERSCSSSWDMFLVV